MTNISENCQNSQGLPFSEANLLGQGYVRVFLWSVECADVLRFAKGGCKGGVEGKPTL